MVRGSAAASYLLGSSMSKNTRSSILSLHVTLRQGRGGVRDGVLFERGGVDGEGPEDEDGKDNPAGTDEAEADKELELPPASEANSDMVALTCAGARRILSCTGSPSAGRTRRPTS